MNIKVEVEEILPNELATEYIALFDGWEKKDNMNPFMNERCFYKKNDKNILLKDLNYLDYNLLMPLIRRIYAISKLNPFIIPNINHIQAYHTIDYMFIEVAKWCKWHNKNLSYFFNYCK